MLQKRLHTLSSHTLTHTHTPSLHPPAALTAAVTPRNEDRRELKRCRGWSGAVIECSLHRPPDWCLLKRRGELWELWSLAAASQKCQVAHKMAEDRYYLLYPLWLLEKHTVPDFQPLKGLYKYLTIPLCLQQRQSQSTGSLQVTDYLSVQFIGLLVCLFCYLPVKCQREGC